MGAMKRLYEARQGKQDKFARGDFDGRSRIGIVR
mgnify:CR=1 FL=1